MKKVHMGGWGGVARGGPGWPMAHMGGGGMAQNNLGIQSWPINGSSEFKSRECKNDFELINLL